MGVVRCVRLVAVAWVRQFDRRRSTAGPVADCQWLNALGWRAVDERPPHGGWATSTCGTEGDGTSGRLTGEQWIEASTTPSPTNPDYGNVVVAQPSSARVFHEAPETSFCAQRTSDDSSCGSTQLATPRRRVALVCLGQDSSRRGVERHPDRERTVPRRFRQMRQFLPVSGCTTRDARRRGDGHHLLLGSQRKSGPGSHGHCCWVGRERLKKRRLAGFPAHVRSITRTGEVVQFDPTQLQAAAFRPQVVLMSTCRQKR